MKFFIKRFTNISNEKKVFVLSFVFFLVLVVIVAIPTLSRYKNRTSIYNVSVWDGSVATSYRSGDGSKDNPYVISNGSELAYFALQLKTNKYENMYFVLNNDIVLNDGIFSYTEDEGINYRIDNNDNKIVPNEDSDLINEFSHLDGFKGNFDGNSYSIYGLYIDEVIDGKNALFTNLEGNISNLYVENSIVYGGYTTAGVVSDAYNSTISDVVYNGYVIGDSNLVSDIRIFNIDNFTKDVSMGEFSEVLKINNFNSIYGKIANVSLTGEYEYSTDVDSVLKINNEVVEVGKFELDLGSLFNNSISVVYITSSDSTFSLKDLKVNVSYDIGNAAGVVSIADNTVLNNIINKSNVFGSVYASGIVNFINNGSSLSNSYNTGTVFSDYMSSGIISSINNNLVNTDIVNCYNAGELNSNNSAMIGVVENNIGGVKLSSLFNVIDNYVIYSINSSDVVVENSFVVFEKYINNGMLSKGEFVLTVIDNLYDKSFVKKELLFKEFNDLEDNDNADNVWIFENDSLPILYIDDLNNPIANIHVSKYTWDNYSNNLNTLKFSDTFVFNIEGVNDLHPIKEIYYYISNVTEPLSKGELDVIDDWLLYENIVNISDEGFYVVYAKIVDYNDNIIYINSDLLVLDLTGSIISITSSDGGSWNSFDSNLANHYINDNVIVNIDAVDDLSGINNIYYYLSDVVLSLDELKLVENWKLYSDKVIVDSNKTIVYVKVIDNCNYVTYANSDLFIFNGYSLNKISLGMRTDGYDNMYISEDSKISFNFVYKDDNGYTIGQKHQLISNVLLPENTRITLIDKIKSKVYYYVTNNSLYGYDENSYAIYSFELFSEIGSNIKFNEEDYSGNVDEDFVVVVDFLDAYVNRDINDIVLSLRLFNDNLYGNRNTLVSTYKSFSLIKGNNSAKLVFNSDFSDTIYYNSDSEYNVDFSVSFDYLNLDENEILDSTYEDKNIGLMLRLVDDNNTVVDSRYLKNLSFKIGDKNYYPSSDGYVRIDLGNAMFDVVNNLKIGTFVDNSKLKEGNYKFLLSLYVGDDSIYSNDILNTIEIPVVVSNKTLVNYKFDVVMNSVDRIVDSNSKDFVFDILSDFESDDVFVTVSLYKKDSLSAYNQEYSLVDLGSYSSLNKYNDYSYYAIRKLSGNDKFNLTFDASSLKKNGYMFVFEFYDGQGLIGRVSRKFIVR